MPQTLNVAAFVFGAILVLIALLGGRFKLFGAEISETVSGAGRGVAGLLGVVLIALGFLHQAPSITAPTPPESGRPVAPVEGVSRSASSNEPAPARPSPSVPTGSPADQRLATPRKFRRPRPGPWSVSHRPLQ